MSLIENQIEKLLNDNDRLRTRVASLEAIKDQLEEQLGHEYVWRHTAEGKVEALKTRVAELESLYAENEERCNQYLIATDVAESRAKELKDAERQPKTK